MEKNEVHKYCIQIVDDKVERLQFAIESAQSAANEDTKSSAGDKYETNREMMQAEKEKSSYQLAQVLKMKALLNQIKVFPQSIVDLGSLVETNLGLFYISVGLGEITLANNKVFVISLASPMGAAIKGLKKGDKTVINGREVEINNIS